MMRFQALRAIALGVTFGLAGCSFAPPAKPPHAPDPEQYTVAPTPSASAEAQGVAQRFALGQRAVPEWWKAYGSADLDALVDEGLRNSPSLEAARHTLESVRQQYRAVVGDTLWPSLDAGGQVSFGARHRAVSRHMVGSRVGRELVHRVGEILRVRRCGLAAGERPGCCHQQLRGARRISGGLLDHRGESLHGRQTRSLQTIDGQRQRQWRRRISVGGSGRADRECDGCAKCDEQLPRLHDSPRFRIGYLVTLRITASRR